MIVDGYKITETENGFRIEKSSGEFYLVKYQGSGDGDPDYCGLWGCNCPAGQHGRHCKHIDMVSRYLSNI